MKSTRAQFIFLSFLFFKLSNQETCHYANEAGTVDLTPLNSLSAFQAFITPPVTPNQTSTTYLFHPCTDASKIPTPSDTAIVDDKNICLENGYSLCEVKFNLTENTWNYTLIGKSENGKIINEDGALHIAYNNGVVVNLVCVTNLTGGDTSILVLNGQALYFYSPYACLKLKNHESAHSVGAVLLLILGIFLLVYFIGGYFFKYYVTGSRGVEAFPHHEFWTNIPGLVRDGIKFIANGCRPTPVEDYEQI